MDFYRPPTLQGALDALGSVNKALRAWKFYPQGHPVRKTSIKQAHAAMLSLLDGNHLSLNCGRTDFSFPDGESLKDTTRMSSSLSYELFIRRVRKITFLNDVHEEDLLDFLRLLTTAPEVVQKAGGMDTLMVDHGIRTIWVNEFDLSIIHDKRRDVEIAGNNPLGLDEIENGPEPGAAESEEMVVFLDDQSPAGRLQMLIGKLTVTVDDDPYQSLIRQALICSESLKTRHELAALFPFVELLAAQANDPERRETLRECARFGLEQLAAGNEFLAFLLDRLDQDAGISYKASLAVLAAAGPVAVDLTVERLGATENLAVRKSLSTLMVNLGVNAVPAILRRMGDGRWYIVRNLAAILGDIGSVEAVSALQMCLLHSDVRVCNEAIRSLAKIGGKDSEAAILEVLRGNDPSLYPQSIASLGGMKSRNALVDLMRIVCRHDLFLKHLSLKVDALGAIAMIGDRQAVPILSDLLERWHVVAPDRWKQFNIAIAGCLARLGDVRAIPALEKKAAGSGELGRACLEALETIGRTGGGAHGGA